MVSCCFTFIEEINLDKLNRNFNNLEEQISHTLNLHSIQEGIYGIFLSNNEDMALWSKKLNELKVPFISKETVRIFDPSTIKFLRMIANLTKDQNFIDALNYGATTLDKEAYIIYKRQNKIYAEDWKMLNENNQFVIDKELFSTKMSFLMKYLNLGTVNTFEFIQDLKKEVKNWGITYIQLLQIENILNFAAVYPKSETEDKLQLFMDQLDKISLKANHKSKVYLFTPSSLLEIHYEYLLVPELKIKESIIHEYIIDLESIEDLRIHNYILKSMISFNKVQYFINKENLPVSFKTKLDRTKKELIIFDGVNAPDILSQDEKYQNLIKKGVLNSTHQTWINTIYSRYADSSKYPLLANEIKELYSNLFYVLEAHHEKKSTFETSTGTIRVFFRFTIKIILDTLTETKQENINLHLRGHSANNASQTKKSFNDSIKRMSLIEYLKEKKYLMAAFSYNDFLNVSKLNNFMDGAAHRGDITKYTEEDEARTKFRQMNEEQQLEMLLSVFKFLYSLELSPEILTKIEKNLSKYYIFNNT